MSACTIVYMTYIPFVRSKLEYIEQGNKQTSAKQTIDLFLTELEGVSELNVCHKRHKV